MLGRRKRVVENSQRIMKVQTIEGKRLTWSKYTSDWDTAHKEDNDRSYWLKLGLPMCLSIYDNDIFWVRKAR